MVMPTSYSPGNCVSCKKLKGVVRIWCPTWISAHQGPQMYCEHDAKVFDPAQNPHSSDGQFFYGDEADAAFQSVEAFIPRSDERYENAKGMILNGQHVAGDMEINENKIAVFDSKIAVVDGKVWLLSQHLAIRLGDWPDVKGRYPKLFV